MNLKIGLQFIFCDQIVLQLRECRTFRINETTNFHYFCSVPLVFSSENREKNEKNTRENIRGKVFRFKNKYALIVSVQKPTIRIFR